jgi:adenylate kinase family enzyme
MDLDGYHRIAVVGSGGSGKSWLATRLADATGLPVIHLDKEFWKPGWVMTAKAQRVVMHEAWIAGERWIIDGNYASLMPPRFAAADLVIFLDINRTMCLWGALRRLGTTRPDMPDGVREPGFFSRDFWQFCHWIWTYPASGRPKVLALHAENPDVVFWRITTRRQVERLIRIQSSRA